MTETARKFKGRRINSPADDPVAAARVAHLDASLARLDQYQSNAIFARNQLGLEEESLNDVIGNLHRIRELTLQANNSTASNGDRHIIAAEIRQHRDALLTIANTTDVDGRHLFGGYREAATPFITNASGSVVYNGADLERFRSPRPGLKARLARRFGLYGPFVLYVARLEHPGKNHVLLLERFFHTLKTELVYHEHYRTRETAPLAIFEWI